MAPDDTNDWRPSASFAVLQLRARLLARVRAYFERAGVLEVETPVLSKAAATDPHLHSFTVRSLAPDDDQRARYLHTSPEFAMKRLLAAGSGSIYQLCKTFRAGELGQRHNPEFTMLEWYRVGYDHHQLMSDVETLVAEALTGLQPLEASEKLSYRDAFLRYAQVDPLAADNAELRECARSHDIAVTGLAANDTDGWRDLLLTHVVEPHLGRGPRLTFIYDYPASQAALARIRADEPPRAERFELYIGGVELANGFHELANEDEQRRRFSNDQRFRNELGLAPLPVDRALLAALRHGLPDCSGVALGFDRLVMLAAGASSIAQVMAFSADRA